MYCAPTKLTTLDKLVPYSRYLKTISPTNSSMQKVEKQPPSASLTEFQTSQKKNFTPQSMSKLTMWKATYQKRK